MRAPCKSLSWGSTGKAYSLDQDFDDYEPDIYDSGEDFIVGHGSSLLDWDSEDEEG